MAPLPQAGSPAVHSSPHPAHLRHLPSCGGLVQVGRLGSSHRVGAPGTCEGLHSPCKRSWAQGTSCRVGRGTAKGRKRLFSHLLNKGRCPVIWYGAHKLRSWPCLPFMGPADPPPGPGGPRAHPSASAELEDTTGSDSHRLRGFWELSPHPPCSPRAASWSPCGWSLTAISWARPGFRCRDVTISRDPER